MRELRFIVKDKVELIPSIPNRPYEPVLIIDVYLSKQLRIRMKYVESKSCEFLLIKGLADRKVQQKISIEMITKLLASKRISCALLKVFLGWYHLKDVDEFAYVELVVNLRTNYKIITGEFEIPENKLDQVKQALIKVFGAESVTTKSAYELLCS